MKTTKRFITIVAALIILCCAAFNGSEDAPERSEETEPVPLSDFPVYKIPIDDGYYYPVIKACYYYYKSGEMTSFDEYVYSSEGYLLKEKNYTMIQWFDDVGEMALTNTEEYTYDESGRMIKEVRDQRSWGCEYENLFYDRWETAYAYDDNGRESGEEFICENFVTSDPYDGIDPANLIRIDGFVWSYATEYREDETTGGYLGRTTRFKDGGEVYSITEKLYSQDGSLLSKKLRFPDGQTNYTTYEYDNKGRILSSSEEQTGRKDKESGEELNCLSFCHSVEYDKKSRVAARKRQINNSTETWTYYYNDDDSYAGCDLLYDHGDASIDKISERCEYDESGKLIRMIKSYEYAGNQITTSDKKEFSDYDENGNCCTVTYYKQNYSGDWELYVTVTYEYGEKIPKGVKYGTSQETLEEERFAALYAENDDRMF